MELGIYLFYKKCPQDSDIFSAMIHLFEWKFHKQNIILLLYKKGSQKMINNSYIAHIKKMDTSDNEY